jgi:hypothetical protein
VVAWLLAVVLQWVEPEVDDGGASSPPSIKLAGLSLDLGIAALLLPPPSHHGGGQDEKRLEGAVVGDSMEGQSGADVLPCVLHGEQVQRRDPWS